MSDPPATDMPPPSPVPEQAAGPHEVFNAPASEFVAHFMGGHNVLDCAGQRIAVRSDLMTVHLNPQAVADGPLVSGEVCDVEYQGSYVLLGVMAEGGQQSLTVSQREAEFNAILAEYPVPNIRCYNASQSVEGKPIAWDVLEASDAVLVTSGTATLETALFKRPMVISYVLSPLMKKLMAWKSGQQRPYLPWVGLPNVLARDFVVPELLQDDATPEKLAEEVWTMLTDEKRVSQIVSRFNDIHETLRCDTPKRATQALLQVINDHKQ
jgi:hypothetical protein